MRKLPHILTSIGQTDLTNREGQIERVGTKKRGEGGNINSFGEQSELMNSKICVCGKIIAAVGKHFRGQLFINRKCSLMEIIHHRVTVASTD